MFPKKQRPFNFSEGSQCPDFNAVLGALTNSPQFAETTNVQHILWLKEFLPQGWNQIRATRQHLNVCGVLCQKFDGLFNFARPQQTKRGQTQSSPPAAGWPAREGSSACLRGPLPRNHKAPPCSRRRCGLVGSTPSVRFSFLACFFARNAASTRSGVKG